MAEPADLVVTNARVLTMDGAAPRAEAVAVRDGRVLAVGGRAEVEALAGPATRIVDAKGCSVLPGFVESHMHLFMGGASLGKLAVDGVGGLEGLTARVRAWAAAHPEEELTLGVQAAYLLADGRPLDRHHLDAVLPDRPLALYAYDGHTVWANTAALERADLLRGRDLRPGNEIVMGPDGLATGELREPEAFAPLMALTPTGGRESLGLTTGRDPDPPASPTERAADRATLAQGLAYCASFGITSIHNMDGNPYQQGLLEELDDAGDLPCRMRLPFHHKAGMALDELREVAPTMRARGRPDRLVADFVKVFVDGVLDSTTAFTLEDYCGRPGHRGLPLFTAEELNDVATLADSLSFQVAIHSIGDAGVRRTLDAFAAARAANGARDSRHRVEHIEIIHPDDIPRFRELGAMASMQPLHAPGPLSYPGHELMALLGEARHAYAFAWRTLREAGARMCFASDWPVSPVDPLLSIQAAVTRRPWTEELPGQAQTLHEAIDGYTAGGAYAAFMEDRLGRLRPGFLADLVVLGGDIEAAPPDAIKDLGVRLTVCGGRVTYEAG